MMQIRFDTLKAEYLDSLAKLDKLCFTIPWSRRLFENELENPGAYYVLALSDDEVIAYGGMTSVLDEGNITNIAVHPEFRGRKIASQILTRLIDFAQKNNLATLMLELRESNHTAYGLYTKFGFGTVGKRKNYYSDNHEAAVLMTKYLI